MPRHLSRQLFIASEQFVRAFSVEEVEASWRDMAEMGLAWLPYPEIDLVLPANLICYADDESFPSPTQAAQARTNIAKWKIKLRYTDGIGTDWFCDSTRGDWWSLDEVSDPEFTGKKSIALESAMKFLTVALATRNVVKTVTVNKAARLGIGRAAREGYAASTTLTVGEIDESVAEGDGPGSHHASPRPHLRRGHIRRQHHGPNNELVKRIWVQPTFVNVDEEFVNRRTAYNLRPKQEGS